MYRFHDPLLEQEVLSPETPPARLRELLWQDPKLMTLGVQNPALPEELLEEVLHRDIREWFRGYFMSDTLEADVGRGIAKNPNTPLQTLHSLSEKYPSEVKENPAYALFMLEETRLSEKINYRLLIESLLSEDAVDSWRESISRSFSYARFLLARSDKSPTDLLRLLATDTDTEIRALVAKNPRTPSDILSLLSQDTESEVRAAVCDNPRIPLPLLLSLSPSFPAAMSSLARHPDTPEETLDALAERDELLPLVLQNPNAPASLLSACAPIEELQVLVARHPKTPLGVLLSLPKTHYISSALLENASLPPHWVERFLFDDEQDLRALAASHPNAPKQTLELLYAAGASSDLRARSATTEALSPQELIKLYNKGAFWRQLVAAHPDTPESLLLMLSQDPSPSILWALLDRVRLPASLEGRLSHNTNAEIRAGVARIATNEETLRRLASDYFSSVREGAAHNKNLPTDVWRRLAQDTATSVRLTLASSAETPPDTLDLLGQDADRAVRRIVVDHPNTRPETLSRLIRDIEPHIQKSAESRLAPLPERASRRANFVPILRRNEVNTPTEDVWKIAREVLQRRIKAQKKKG